MQNTQNGIFTTIKVVDTMPLFLKQHLMRLGIENKKDFVKKQIKKLLQKNATTHAAVRISVLDTTEIFFHARELPESNQLVSAVTIHSNQKLPTKKIINRSIFTLALKDAKKMNAQEVVFTEENNLLETTIANLISQDKNGNLVTPKLTLQGLKGITRQLLLDKKYVIEKDIPVNITDPLIAVNSLRVFGIEKLNGTVLASPMPLMKKVQLILQKEEENYANSYYR